MELLGEFKFAFQDFHISVCELDEPRGSVPGKTQLYYDSSLTGIQRGSAANPVRLHSLAWLPCFAGSLRFDVIPQWCYNGVNQIARHKESGDRETHRVIVPVDSQKDGLRY